MRTLHTMLKGTVLYHLPQGDEIILIEGTLNLYKEGDEGFMISPYSKEENRYILSVEREEHIPVFRFKPDQLTEHQSPDSSNYHFTSYHDFTTIVGAALKAIENQKIQKVVLSRCEKMLLPAEFQVQAFFRDLCLSYPDAFTYFLNVPVFGTWIGASPELLLRTEGASIHTMALAGTRLHAQNKNPSFSDKEFNEQLIVREFVKEVLEKHCSEVSLQQGFRQAGNLEHIVTYFTAQAKEGFSPLKLAFDLHPTPAVCGIPLKEANDFIMLNEQYDRKLYSGFLGRIKGSATDLYVNLRCMEISGADAVLYSGCGIVEGSDPAEEWKETENKMETLKKVLGVETKNRQKV